MINVVDTRGMSSFPKTSFYWPLLHSVSSMRSVHHENTLDGGQCQFLPPIRSKNSRGLISVVPKWD